jgi:hypothetical protein
MSSFRSFSRFLAGALCLIALAAVFFSCGSYKIVTVAPRIDLKRFNTIGVITFTSANGSGLAQKATQRFIESIQNAQPGLLVLELGNKDDLLKAVGKTELNADALKAIGEAKSVAAVLFAELSVEEPKTTIGLQSLDLRSLNAKESVKAALGAKLWLASNGALAWSDSARGEWTLARASLSSIRVNDYDEKYNQMVDDLVAAVTRDLRPTRERRLIEK